MVISPVIEEFYAKWMNVAVVVREATGHTYGAHELDLDTLM